MRSGLEVLLLFLRDRSIVFKFTLTKYWIMAKSPENPLKDLTRLLESKKFDSEKDLQNFLNSLVGKTLPSLPKDKLSSRQQAEDLVLKAYNLPPAEGKKIAEEALQLNEDCIDAYEYLGVTENSLEKSAEFFTKGIEIGRKLFLGENLEKYEGEFWGMHETRPFMRCLYYFSDCLYEMDKKQKTVEVLEELILLNPNDNQGVRNQLCLYCLELNLYEKFELYTSMFEEDMGVFPSYNNALFSFKTSGETERTNSLLQEALEYNKYVPKILISKNKITESPIYHGIGDENEAIYYAHFAQSIWQKNPNALIWLKKTFENF